MLSKKKDSGINDGIAGKYVKRETPPMLRNYHTPVRQTPNFQRRSVKTPATFYVPQQAAGNVIGSRAQVTTRSNVQSNVSSLETRAQQLSPLTQQRNTQSAPPNIAQLSQGLQNLSVGDRSEGASGSTSSLTTQGSTTSQGTTASSGYGSGPQPPVSDAQQGTGQKNNLGAIREDFHEAGNLGGAQGNYTDYHSQFDENYQIQQYHEEIRNHYAQQSGGHVSSTQHSLQSSTQQSSTSSCKYSNQCADKMGQYPGSIFQNAMENQGYKQAIPSITNRTQNTIITNSTQNTIITNSTQNTITNSTQNTKPLTSAALGNQSCGETAFLEAYQTAQAKALQDPDNLYSVLDGYQHDKSSSNMNPECNKLIDNPDYVHHDQSSSNLCNIQSIHTSTSTNSLQHSSSQSTITESQQNLSNVMQHSCSNLQHSHSSSSFQSSSSISESLFSNTGPVVNWQYSPLQQEGADVLQTNSTMHSVLSSSSLCSSSSFVSSSGISGAVVQQSNTIQSDCSSSINAGL